MQSPTRRSAARTNTLSVSLSTARRLPHGSFFESIPKRQTNATREYLARYVLGTSATPMLHENSRLLVPQMLGRFCLAVPSDLSRLYSSPVFCVYWPPVLVVVIGKTRVKTQHDDDHCPQNDQ